MRPNKCLSFDGDDYVDLGDGSDFKDLVAATYGLWVNFDGLNLANALGDGFALTKDSNNRFEIGFGSWTGSYDDEAVTVSQLVGGSTLLRACLRETGNSAKTIMASGWHLFMLATDASGNYWYLDGKQETPSYAIGAATTASVSKIPLATSLRISGRIYDASYRFYGLIDEVCIYNRALSADEIAYNYNGGAGTLTPYSRNGLVGWWHMDEGSGLYIYDETTNANTGTITGASWVAGFPFMPAVSVPRRARI